MLKPRPSGPVVAQSLNPSALNNQDLHPKPISKGVSDTAGEDKGEESDDTDAEPEAQNPSGHSVASFRKRVRQENFNAWAAEKQVQLATTDRKAIFQAVSDHQLSTANLIRKQEFSASSMTPREYQLELFERAKKQNTIAVLDTGSGKTLIAVLLLRHIIDEELTHRGQGKQPRISFFLVDSVTLVYQQYAVLDNNIDQNIGHICGAMGTDRWSKDTWTAQFKKNMVIVCTAEILRCCLSHAYIPIKQINLLIFDEAHHAKKNHPFAKIIEDFYLPSDILERPRIFGMTASPVDAKVDVVKAASDLEELLDSKIATTSDLSLLRKSIRRPDEVDWVYETSPGFRTPLYYALEARFSNMNTLKGLFKSAKYAAEELGPWASDRVWQHGLKEEESEKIQRRLERTLNSSSNQAQHKDRFGADEAHDQTQEEAVAWIDKQLGRIRKAREIVASFPTEKLEAKPAHLSQKVLRLHSELCRYFERKTSTKCIVFVQQRHTARILCDVFERTGTPFLKPGVLIGVRSGGDENVTYRTQVLTLMAFRKGELNCLFATSVAEEGLDIPDCNLVIRFDLYATVIQYIQSRGRARHMDSTFVHMIENGNETQRGLREVVQDTERLLQSFCQSLPEDRCLNERTSPRKVQRGLHDQAIKFNSTGAVLTPHSSLSVLAHFAACLNYDETASSQLNYLVRTQDRMYQAEVFLPETHLCPLKSVIGDPAPSKSKAKQSAAVKAIKRLVSLGLFDTHLNPIYQRRVHTMQNAHLAIKGKKTGNYDMLVKPRIWASTRGEVPKELYMVIIELKASKPLGKPYQPLAFFTRTPMPSFPNFPVYLEEDVETAVVSTIVPGALSIPETLMEQLVGFTFCIFEDCFNKLYKKEPSKMSYWLAPVSRGWRTQRSKEHVIDYALLREIANNDGIRYPKNVPLDAILGKLLLDPNAGKFRYFPICVEPSLKPNSPIPAHMPSRRKAYDILSYSSSLWGTTRSRWIGEADPNQPVLKTEMVSLKRNFLDRMSDKEKKEGTECYVCPQPLKISALTTAIAATTFVFPAILSRFESYLIAQEACDLLGLKIRPDLALEAVTKDSDNTDEHRGEQIQCQRGMGRNYERLEFLGDCFLKMGTSIAIFASKPKEAEDWYHNCRMTLICNRNLYSTAMERRLFEFIRSKSFERAAWYPEGLTLLEGKKYSPTTTHALGEKTIADVCEALIGAAALSVEKGNGLNSGVIASDYERGGKFDMAVKAVTVLVNNESASKEESSHLNINCWADYFKLYILPEWQTAPASSAQLNLAQQIENKMGYKFRYPRLLRSAFVHPSYGYLLEKVPNYQRLEFLGDSLLDMACVMFLYHRYPDRDPQWLTEHKMAMVSNKFYGAVAIKLGFNKHLRHNTPMVLAQITEYANEVAQAKDLSNGAADYWLATKDPPKCLPDVVEAYVGALFVDSNFNYEEVDRFFETHIRPYFDDMSLYDTYANNHPVVRLEKLMLEAFGCCDWYVPTKSLDAIDGAEPQNVAAVMIHNNIVAEGMASAGRNAKVKACAKAITKLESMPPFKFRKNYGCNCTPEGFSQYLERENLSQYHRDTLSQYQGGEKSSHFKGAEDSKSNSER